MSDETVKLFIDLEDMLADKLTAKFESLERKPKVLIGQDFENIRDKSQSGQTVFVAYNGIIGVDQLPANPRVAMLTLEYILWVVTKSSRSHGNSKGTRDNADPVILSVIAAIMGWRPTPESAFKISTAPAQVYADGFGYFPLAFTITRQIRGD